MQLELAGKAVSLAETGESIMADFRKSLVERIPKLEHTQRRYWGRSLDLTELEWAMRAANCGRMRDLTDLSREQNETDGHQSSLLAKRFARLKALGWEVQPAKGSHVDDTLAGELACCVEESLSRLDMPEAIERLAWGVFDGRAALEKMWDYRGGVWELQRLAWIHPRRLSFGPQRELRVTDEWEVGEFLPIGLDLQAVPHKFIRYTPQLWGDYAEREGLHRRLLFWSLFGRFTVRERLILIELFSKPWRIGMPSADGPWDIDADQAAYDALADLGGNDTATLPPGYEVLVDTPGEGSSVPHKDALEHSQMIQSKLILGNTSSTDATAVGLGGGLADAHLSEEDLIIVADGLRMEPVLTRQLGLSILMMAYGARPELRTHMPRIRPKVSQLMDPLVQAGRLKAATEVGMPVAASEAYELLGLRQPEPDEAVLIMVTRDTMAGAQTAVQMAYPPGEVPPALIVAPDPLTMDPGEAPGAPGAPGALPPAGGADGVEAAAGPPPSEARAQANADHLNAMGLDRCEHGRPNRCPQCGVERGTREVQVGDDGNPQRDADGNLVWKIQWEPIGGPPKVANADPGDPAAE